MKGVGTFSHSGKLGINLSIFQGDGPCAGMRSGCFKSRFMKRVVARLNGRFLLLCLVLLPVTMGVGSVLLWLWRRSFVYSIDGKGIVLWSGRAEPWHEVQGYNMRKRQGNTMSKTSRIDITFAVGYGVILPSWLANGEELLHALQHNMRRAVPPKGRMRIDYVPRYRWRRPRRARAS